MLRAKFLDFEKCGEWNIVIPKIAVKSGDLNNVETKAKLSLTLNFARKGEPAPTNPVVYENSPEVFNLGFNMFVLKAEHVHIFEASKDGNSTRFINYEKMSGILKSLVMN